MTARPFYFPIHVLVGFASALFFTDAIQPLLRASAAEPSVIAGAAIVKDGDTIRIGHTSIRLKGIAAPELHEPGGAEAKRALQQLIKNQTVQCALTGEKTHERNVGYCTIGTIDINAMMVSTGFALSCPRFSERYVGLEPRSGLVQRIGYEPPHYCRKLARATRPR